MGEPWYKKYKELHEEVEHKRNVFEEMCKELNVDPQTVLSEFSTDIIARIVHESNWQEGIYLNLNQTREVAVIAFESLEKVLPHIEFDVLLEMHYQQINQYKKEGVSNEKLAAYNLAKAHVSLHFIQRDMLLRINALLAKAIIGFSNFLPEIKNPVPEDLQKSLTHALKIVKDIQEDNTSTGIPYVGGTTYSEVFNCLLEQEFDDILNAPNLNFDHIHFLHRITLAGIISPTKLGVFRDVPIHVGDPDIYFAPPTSIPNLMEKFCNQFPPLPLLSERDPIMTAADVSYKFVRIHPYVDGNGRISRLLMNLVLYNRYPPVYIKATKEGKHRYSQALKRANRGNLEPLASLIAIAIIDIYSKLIDALSVVSKGNVD